MDADATSLSSGAGVCAVEPATLDQARGQTQSHRCVVGQLAGPKEERATADHVVGRLERSRTLELQRGAQRVASLVDINRTGCIRLNAFGKIDDLTVGATLARLINEPRPRD